MRVGTVLSSAFETEFAVYFWMKIEALLSIAACWEVLALLRWVYEGAVLIRAMWKVLAPHLLFGRLAVQHNFLCQFWVGVLAAGTRIALLDFYPLDSILCIFDDDWPEGNLGIFCLILMCRVGVLSF